MWNVRVIRKGGVSARCAHGLLGLQGQPLVYMFNNRNYNRTFFNAPQSVTSFVAAFLEPSITVACLLAAMAYFDEPVMRASMALCLLVFALTFPGRNRFADNRTEAVVDILTSWVSMLAILWLCGYATNSLVFFESNVILSWAVITPLVQWVVTTMGKAIIGYQNGQPDARRPR
jgi:putative colanic acid biosynthesis UDP-glucose lipid carrier transferase